MAEFAYARHLRDELGHTGEIIYPNKDMSKQDRDGVWLRLGDIYNGPYLSKW